MNKEIKRPLQPVVKETIVNRSLYNIQISLEKGLRMGYTLEKMLSAFTNVGRECVIKMIIEYEIDNYRDYAAYKGITHSRVPQILQRANREINRFLREKLTGRFESNLNLMYYIESEEPWRIQKQIWNTRTVDQQMADIVREWLPMSDAELMKLADIATAISKQLSE